MRRLGRRLAQLTYVSHQLLSLARFECHLLRVRWNCRLNPRSIAKQRLLLRLDEVKLHYGCGSRIFPGWINVDAAHTAGIDLQMDLRTPLPLRSNSTRFIFAEHVLEHMDPRTDLPRVLKEFHRVLKPGGVVRVIVPDLAKYCDAYVRSDLEWFRHVIPGTPIRSQAMNDVFYLHFHRHVHDFESLAGSLRDAGFRRIEQTDYAVSRVPELCLDLQAPSRIRESLCVEATKDHA
jgi:predicted SAM-dependent methyltransferase